MRLFKQKIDMVLRYLFILELLIFVMIIAYLILLLNPFEKAGTAWMSKELSTKSENYASIPFQVNQQGKLLYQCINCPKKFCKDFSCTMKFNTKTKILSGNCSCEVLEGK